MNRTEDKLLSISIVYAKTVAILQKYRHTTESREEKDSFLSTNLFVQLCTSFYLHSLHNLVPFVGE